MAVLVKGLSDRNIALRKTYAITLGHLVRLAKESSVSKLLSTLENRFIEAEDEDSRMACIHTLQVSIYRFIFYSYYISIGWSKSKLFTCSLCLKSSFSH